LDCTRKSGGGVSCPPLKGEREQQRKVRRSSALNKERKGNKTGANAGGREGEKFGTSWGSVAPGNIQGKEDLQKEENG